jgi:hypothetical protein
MHLIVNSTNVHLIFNSASNQPYEIETTGRGFYLNLPVIGGVHLIRGDVVYSDKLFEVVRYDNGEREVFFGGDRRWRLHVFWTPAKVQRRYAAPSSPAA